MAILMDLEKEYEVKCDEMKLASKRYSEELRKYEVYDMAKDKYDEIRDLDLKSAALHIEVILKEAKEIKEEIQLHKIKMTTKGNLRTRGILKSILGGLAK